jgi:hypothetical protein
LLTLSAGFLCPASRCPGGLTAGGGAALVRSLAAVSGGSQRAYRFERSGYAAS